MPLCNRCPAPATHVILSTLLPTRQETACLANDAPPVPPRNLAVATTPQAPYFCAACAKARIAARLGTPEGAAHAAKA